MPNVMPRSSSFAEVLGELEEVKQAIELEEKHHKIRQQQAPARNPPPPAPRKAAPPAAPSHRSLFDVALLGVALAVGAALAGGWTRETAVALPACLTALALALLGVGQVAHVVAQCRSEPHAVGGASWLRVPLTDAVLSIEVCNKFANSCQVSPRVAARQGQCVCVCVCVCVHARTGLKMPQYCAHVHAHARAHKYGR